MNELKSKKTGKTTIVSDEELALFSPDLLRKFVVTKLTLRPIIEPLKKEIVTKKNKKNEG